MKRLPAFYSTLVLIAPLLVIAILLAGPFGCGGGGGGNTIVIPPQGSVEIGFVDSPSSAFQAISLNIVGVRLNPSTDPNVSDLDPNWVTVTAPPASGPGELSVNLLDFQNDAIVFNIGQVTAQQYNQVEVVLDGGLPGTVMPSCTTGAQEGCITANASLSGSSNLRTTASQPGGINVTPNGLTSVILDINPGKIVFPTKPGGNFTLSPTISIVSNSFLATVSGTVTGISSTTSDTVSAELTGTNSIVASAPVVPSSSNSSVGTYTFQLPAGVSGTAYDLFVSGDTTFDVISDLTLKRGGTTPSAQDFAVTSTSFSTIAGSVLNQSGNALVGATVNLLLPAKASDDCATSLAGCVIVSTTTTNSAGTYSLPPVQAPPAGTSYYVQATTTGANTVTQELTFGPTGTCPAGANPSNCSFKLGSASITGTVAVDPPPSAGTNIVVTVMAEQTGTGNLVGLTQVTVSPTGSAPFTIQVPTTPATNVDLIASAQDAYLGIGTPFPGHSFAVASNINPAAPPPPPGVPLNVTCLGHGTIAGVANASDSGTHVLLFQNGVQLMDSTVGSTVPIPGASATPAYPNQYSFCAPPNTYTVQRVEVTGSVASPVASQIVTVPTPIATATAPCPVCSDSALPPGMCPGNCSATNASPF